MSIRNYKLIPVTKAGDNGESFLAHGNNAVDAVERALDQGKLTDGSIDHVIAQQGLNRPAVKVNLTAPIDC